MKRWMRSLHDADKPVEVSAIDFYKRTFGADELFAGKTTTARSSLVCL
jgi:hypothetical protein